MFHRHEAGVGGIGSAGTGAAVGIWSEGKDFFDRTVQQGLKMEIALLPCGISGRSGHASGHRQDLIEVCNDALQRLSAKVALADDPGRMV